MLVATASFYWHGELFNRRTVPLCCEYLVSPDATLPFNTNLPIPTMLLQIINQTGLLNVNFPVIDISDIFHNSYVY